MSTNATLFCNGAAHFTFLTMLTVKNIHKSKYNESSICYTKCGNKIWTESTAKLK